MEEIDDHLSNDDRQASLEILHETHPDFSMLP
jgi:hypothetical protein